MKNKNNIIVIILIMILLLSACGLASDENPELIKSSDVMGKNEDINTSSDVVGRYILKSLKNYTLI